MTTEINNASQIETLVDVLDTNPEVIVTFRTKAGTNRAMRCTRQLDAIPEAQHADRLDYRLNGESIICVYDFQNSAFRSFRKDSVISYEVTQ